MKLNLLLLFPLLVISQTKQKYTFGKISPEEHSLIKYEKDTTANAVVLYEEGRNYFEVVDGYVRLIKKNYFKIKLFNKEAFTKSNISIPLYVGENGKEKISNIRALTHNKGAHTKVEKKDIHLKKINDNWEETVFTFPNIKENSIIEYEYTITSPFFFNLSGWEFQSDIPKIKTLYTAEIPGNYKYNRALIGPLKLNTNDASLKKHCFYLPSSSDAADCEVLKYGINHVPAFISEDHMLSSSNYISAIKFELSEYMSFTGEKTRFSKTWKNVDKEFKTDKNIGKQSNKKNFFKNKIPSKILTNSNDLEKSKQIYKYIKDHFIWNGKNGFFKNSRVKKAFEEKKGNSCEINLSLLNALSAANLKANFVLLSTRNNGLPTESYPVITDFNYLVVLLTINDKTYLLDASYKNIVFGTLPYKCLNYMGRVMNFEKGSYWINITPYSNNSTNVISKIKIDSTKNITAEVKNINIGYYAINQLNNIQNYSEEKYLESLKNTKNDITIKSYSRDNNLNSKYNITENISLQFEEQDDDYIIIYPFLVDILKENPFKLNKRNYPVDFGYPFKLNYQTNIEIPKGLKTVDQLKNQQYSLSNNAGNISLVYQEKENSLSVSLSVSLRVAINKYHFKAANYIELKDFFNKLVTISTATPIVLKEI